MMKKFASGAMALALVASALTSGRAEAAQQVAQNAQIVISKEADDVPSFNTEDLESIFLGKQTLWKNGKKVFPALLSEETPAAKEFIEKALGKSTAQYRAYWKRRLFSGGGTVPRAFATSAEVIEYVAKTPGAVGVVEKGVRDDRVRVVPMK